MSSTCPSRVDDETTKISDTSRACRSLPLRSLTPRVSDIDRVKRKLLGKRHSENNAALNVTVDHAVLAGIAANTQ
jgi:hypothetical protein